MGKINSRFTRIALFTAAIIAACVIVILLFISPFLKYWIEKNDVLYTGREIKMDLLYANPFTGYVYLKNLNIYEEKGDSLFLSANGLSIDISIIKLFSKEIVISSLSIDHPRIQIAQNKKLSNYDDLVARFSSQTTASQASNWRFSILDTKITNGEIQYREKAIPINYSIRRFMLESTGKKWSVDTVFSKFSFQDGKNEGIVNGSLTLNLANSNYRTTIKIIHYDLEIIRQYLWELINYGMFRATLEATIMATGNLKNDLNIIISGRIEVSDFHFGKTTTDDYFSFKKGIIAISELRPHDLYLFDSLTLLKPYLKFERYDSLDNLQAIFGKKGKNITDITQNPERFNLVIEVARYIKKLTKNFLNSDYKINKLRIDSANFVFNDFSLSEKFSAIANPLFISADSINKSRKRVEFNVHSNFEPYGNAQAFLSVNPKDTSEFDFSYHFKQIPVTIFNPYFLSYTSFPLNRGTIELNGLWNVRNGEISSTNHIVILDPRVAKKIKNKDNHWLPMPFIMALVRERGNVIDYDIPITGNLKKPSFHLRDVVFDVIKNIVVKPPTTPYRLEVKSNETEIEESLTLTWELRQHVLTRNQKRFLKKISTFLKGNPTAVLSVHPVTYTEKEKENILFFETKKKYFLMTHQKSPANFSHQDSIEVNRLSIREDKVFFNYLSKGVSDTTSFTLQEKCLKFVGHELIEKEYKILIQQRALAFFNVFEEDKTTQFLKIHAAESATPFNGFSHYKLNYPSDIPDELSKAFQRMNELNNENPRKRYKRQRKYGL